MSESNNTENWVNVTCVEDTSEIEMDAKYTGSDPAARFRHRPLAMTRWGQHARELGVVNQDWTPGLPTGHRWRKDVTP